MDEAFDPQESIRDLERAEAAPYVGLGPAPWWIPPVFGAWFAAYVGAFAFWSANRLLFVGLMIGLSAGIGAFFGWLTRSYGAMPVPGRGTPPPEIRREYGLYAVGAVAIAVVVGVVSWSVGLAAGAAAAFVCVTAGLAWYQVRYERAAAATRDRLA